MLDRGPVTVIIKWSCVACPIYVHAGPKESLPLTVTCYVSQFSPIYPPPLYLRYGADPIMFGPGI